MSTLVDTNSQTRIYADEFRLKSRKTGALIYDAYQNQEVTDYFEFNDKEAIKHKDKRQLSELEEVS